jgi:hypothetical protein
VFWRCSFIIYAADLTHPHVAPHSDGYEFPLQMDKYRGIGEAAVFQCIGEPVFFDRAVEMVMERVAARIEEKTPESRHAPLGRRRRFEYGRWRSWKRKGNVAKLKSDSWSPGRLELPADCTAKPQKGTCNGAPRDRGLR